MSDAAATSAAPAKVAKRKSSGKPKKASSHPKYSKMIKDALVALKVRWTEIVFVTKLYFMCCQMSYYKSEQEAYEVCSVL